jgi:hypothetical protein
MMKVMAVIQNKKCEVAAVLLVKKVGTPDRSTALHPPDTADTAYGGG